MEAFHDTSSRQHTDRHSCNRTAYGGHPLKASGKLHILRNGFFKVCSDLVYSLIWIQREWFTNGYENKAWWHFGNISSHFFFCLVFWKNVPEHSNRLAKRDLYITLRRLTSAEKKIENCTHEEQAFHQMKPGLFSETLFNSSMNR